MTPQDRRAVIVTLLEHWHDFQEPAASRLPSGDGGGPALLTSMASHPSVVELARCLKQLRGTMPAHFHHLQAFYDSPWRTKTTKVRRRMSSGRFDLVDGPRQRERVLPEWLARMPVDRETREPRMVARSIDIIGGLYRGEPELPGALYFAKTAGLREFTDKDGTHLTEAA